MVEQWEYMTKFVYADINNEGAREYLERTFPDWRNPPKFTPQTMIPELNEYGADGWELVHMQPVAEVGSNGDVLFVGDLRQWSHVYFCVFKRRKS